MEIIIKEYYIFEKYKNYSIKDLENELINIKNIGNVLITNYDIRKFSVISLMIERFKNGNFKNPYNKPLNHSDIIY